MQEDICSPGDILDPEGAGLGPLAHTITVLLTHATPHPPKEIASYYDEYNDVETLELNYQRQLRRYSDERYISNFNTPENFIDETEEYQLNYENNNTDSPVNYSPIYASEMRNRGPYFQTNRVQFVTPFCNVLKSDSLEIYDTDEVDFPMEVTEIAADIERYDRGKMNLDIQNNLNGVNETIEPKEAENNTLYTCLCLGAFVISTILLIVYPL